LRRSKHSATSQTASSGPPSSALGLDWYSRDLTQTVSKDSPKMSLILSSSELRRERHESTLHLDPSLERLGAAWTAGVAFLVSFLPIAAVEVG